MLNLAPVRINEPLMPHRMPETRPVHLRCVAQLRSRCAKRSFFVVVALTLFGQVFFLHHVQHLFRDRHVLDAVSAHVNLHHFHELVGILCGGGGSGAMMARAG